MGTDILLRQVAEGELHKNKMRGRLFDPKIGPQVFHESMSRRSSGSYGGKNKVEDYGGASRDAGIDGRLGSTAYFERG
jgi:hypothetical protein